MEVFYLILFWLSLGCLLYVYIGYPVLLQVLSTVWRADHPIDENHEPTFSILIAARNERASLPQKIESIRRLNYPREKIQILVASDASDDGTDDYLAQQPDVEWIAMPQQSGKNNALNRLLEIATGEILFFTDANTFLHAGTLSGAARHFGDPKAGAVAGELIFTQDKDWNPVGQGTGLYWEYENAIKRAESRLGSVLVVSGALFAVRRDLVEPLTPHIANDLEIPMQAGARGYSILYEPDCLGFEKAHSDVWEEIRRTSRIVSRGWTGFLVLMPFLLRSPLRLWQFLSHKFLRWFTLLFALAGWAASFALYEHWWAMGYFWLGSIGLICAIIGLPLMNREKVSGYLRPFSILAHLFVMNAAALWGVWLGITGRTPAAWVAPKSAR